MGLDDQITDRTGDANFQYSRWLSCPSEGEEVVISGISGRFPESRTVNEFLDNLLNKRDMVTDSGIRWNVEHPELPKGSGKVQDFDKYDAGYFGVHYLQAETMNPITRISMETAIEAIMDAGLNPSELEGSRTGIFVSIPWSDTETDESSVISEMYKLALLGYLRSLCTNRLSYFLKIKGPSYSVDTACSSFMNAFHVAFKALRNGDCDNALVGCSHATLHPGTTINFFRMGVLSKDGVCKVFDQDADGYVRSDVVGFVLLQKAKNARRIYSQVINVKTNFDGYKEQGITFPSTEAQKELMSEIYQESQLSASQLSFLEAHGTGTQVGDPREAEAIDIALAQKRDKVLLVGSVKSNVGHTELGSGFASLAKVLLIMETGLITPNIHLKVLNKEVDGFMHGRMKVVTEVTKLEEDDAIIGINNFGFGGSNVHAILRRFKKKKSNRELTDDDDVPRLICVSGRTEESVITLLRDINKNRMDCEFVGLLHQIYKTSIHNHIYRGYTIVSNDGSVRTSAGRLKSQQTNLCVLFGQFDKNYKKIASYLLKFTVFKNCISRIDQVLNSENLHPLVDILNNRNKSQRDVLGSICVQIGVVDLLKKLELYPTAVYGEDTGKLASAYYYDVLTLEATVLRAIKISNTERADIKSLPDGVSYSKAFPTNGKKAFLLNISDKHYNEDEVMLLGADDPVPFLEILGSLYEQGHDPQLHELYPKIQFPVSRGTPILSSSIKWEHKKSWYTYNFIDFEDSNSLQKEYNVGFLDEEYKFISGHVIDGRNLFPATQYLYLVWQTFVSGRRLLLKEMPIVFEDCKFVRAVTMQKTGFVSLLVTIQKGSGIFEILEKNSIVVSGRVSTCAIDQAQTSLRPVGFDEDELTAVIQKDEIYRELYLRGYNYGGMFKGIEKCNVDASAGLILWEDNWCSFMDKMLQMKILQLDTRLLYVPTSIKKLVIDPVKQMEIVNKLSGEETLVPVSVYKDCNIIKSGGVEIWGLEAKSIAKKKPPLEPVLETYKFVSNCRCLGVSEAVRVNTQIILENGLGNTFKAVEVIDDCTDPDSECLMYSVCRALADIPMVTSDLVVSSKAFIEEIPGVKVEFVNLAPESNLHLIIGTKILQRFNKMKQLLLSLNKHGFVLTRESLDFKPETINEIIIVTQYTISNEKLILFRKTDDIVDSKFIDVSTRDFKWLSRLQDAMKANCDIVVYTKNFDSEGILGFINCIRREPRGNRIKCFFMMDEAPDFDHQHSFYREQINKNLAINVYENKSWGTYRHMPLGELPEIESEYGLANVATRGDISSLQWFEGSLSEDTPLEKDRALVAVYYSAVNFKDIMAASGRVSLEALTTKRLEQECLLGFEFSGRDLEGRRVMGLIDRAALSSHVAADTDFLMEVPASWTLEDAATVPVVYATVLHSLMKAGELEAGTSILIHSATGGVGLAALNVCLHHKFDVYVTVGTQEKRDYLKKHYPQIPESHIGNSRDISFEEMIKIETKGRGVDIVLNSLSEEKLKASVLCLARGGRFLEIGKFDLANDTSLNLLLLEKEATYYGIMLDRVVTNKYLKSSLVKVLDAGIKAGFVKPLPRVIFDKDQVEASYRYMMTGKHMGKVLVKVRDAESNNIVVPAKLKFKVRPRFGCDPRFSHVIIGGLGGIGLELADWLVIRGARKLVLVSRSGIQSGYQLQRIRYWESYGVEVKISTENVTEEEGCIKLINIAKKMGPVDAIFNLAVVLKDALFEDQTEDSFLDCFAPKAQATKYLDRTTRKLCPNLRHFVIFSSVSCGRGNAGQTNYGMANSIMERICEKRKKDGLAALAIQWGAVGDVGLVAKMQKENKELVIGGTLQQKISSCIEVLDKLLKQHHPVVSSMVVAEKYKSDRSTSPVQAVAYSLGIKDVKAVSQTATFAELGMDSMMGTEIIQLLEKEFEIYVAAKEVRSLTFAKLMKVENEKKNCSETIEVTKTQLGVNMIIQSIPDSSTYRLPIIKLPSLVQELESKTVFLFPGIEGVFTPLEALTKQLNARVLGVQYNFNNPEDTIQEVARNTVSHVEELCSKDSSFFFVGYSFGSLVALEIASLLESKGYRGKIMLLDGSPVYSRSSVWQYVAGESESELQTSLMLKIFSIILPLDVLASQKEKFLSCKDLSERIDFGLTLVPPEIRSKIEKQAGITLHSRLMAVRNYEFTNDKIKSSIHLFKAKFPIVTEEEDYQLSKLAEQPVGVTTIDGDHVTIVNQAPLAEEINEIIKNHM